MIPKTSALSMFMPLMNSEHISMSIFRSLIELGNAVK